MSQHVYPSPDPLDQLGGSRRSPKVAAMPVAAPPPSSAAPPFPLVTEYLPEDDEVYKARYFALKNLVYALEDENNMITWKQAQISHRCRMMELERLRHSSSEPRDHPTASGSAAPSLTPAGKEQQSRAESANGGNERYRASPPREGGRVYATHQASDQKVPEDSMRNGRGLGARPSQEQIPPQSRQPQQYSPVGSTHPSQLPTTRSIPIHYSNPTDLDRITSRDEAGRVAPRSASLVSDHHTTHRPEALSQEEDELMDDY